jgi:hypothetical protein
VLFIGAVGFVAVAGVAAISIGGLAAAPYLAVTAAVLFTAASFALGYVNPPLTAFCNCAGPSCASICAAFRATLSTLMTVVPALIAACAVAATGVLPALAFAVLALAAGIAIAFSLFAKLDSSLTMLKTCADTANPPRPPTKPPKPPGPGPRPK